MRTDVSSDPSLAYTYHGFAGPTPPAPAPAPDTPPWRKPKVVAIIASACALGLVLGVWAKPQFGGDGRAREPMKAVSALPADDGVQIVVNPAKPEPVQTTPGRLEVLPPDMAAAAGAAETALATAPRSGAPPILEVGSREEPLTQPAPLPRVVEVPRPAPSVRPSFDCRYARTQSERMVCQDPSLAAADRRLDRAFRRATAAGVPYDELRGEQDDWISIREAAARRSPEAVASIYDQRIDELEAMAEEYPDQ